VLIEEAEWLGRQLSELEPEGVFPLLDVGSSSIQFRTIHQPWVEQRIFAPLRAAGHAVSHLDAKPADGVDIVADLMEPGALTALRGRGFRSVLCSNLLEHVQDPAGIARSLAAIVPPRGYLFVTCPYRYPFHPDPIDTMFRPTPAELARLFPGTRIDRQVVIRDGTYLDQLRRSNGKTLKLMLRLLLPFYKPPAWRRALADVRAHLPWLFRHFEATCVVLVRD
jgi:SAM-dependent methyltransferase